MKKTKITLALIAAMLASSASYAQNAQAYRVSSTPAFETDFTSAAQKTVDAVVCIKSFATRHQNSYAQGGYDPFGMFDFFFGNPGNQQRQQPRQQQKKSEPVQTGLGSGVIISENGYIVTNNHVIENAEKLEVLFNDNSTYEATVIGTDEATDLALIKIDAKGLKPIKFGNSDDLQVGEWVLAVGNPFGFNSTVTAGIVSAKARSLGSNKGGNMSIESFIQTDAALNPGNSGGALVNLRGELVGINSAIYSNTGSYAGFSFAIPTTIVSKVIEDIQKYGTVQRAMLGCTVVELDAKLAKEKDITAIKAGCLITEVSNNSTAKEIGLQPNDVITAINGAPVKDFAQLVGEISKYRPGDEIKVTYYRDNKKYEKNAKLRNSQGTTTMSKKGEFADLGCGFMKLSSETKEKLGISNGVQVQGITNGAFRDAGVKEGFIITEVNNSVVNSAEDVERIYNKVMKNDSDRVLILRGIYPSTGKRYTYAVNLE